MRSADSFVEVGRARLRFRDEGAGPAVLLVHGWTLDLDMWEPQVAELATRYRMIRFDRRGFGLSTGEPSLRHDIEDVLLLLDRLRVHRAALIGMSQGARVALRAALAHQERVACVVLDGPPDEVAPDRPPDDEIPLAEYRGLAERRGMEAMRRQWSLHPFTQLTTSDSQIRERLREILGRYPGRDLLQPAPASCAPLARRLSALTVRALVINGEHDLDARRTSGLRLSRAIPGARRTLVPDAGHLPNLDNPDFYNAALCRFFKESLDARA